MQFFYRYSFIHLKVAGINKDDNISSEALQSEGKDKRAITHVRSLNKIHKFVAKFNKYRIFFFNLGFDYIDSYI